MNAMMWTWVALTGLTVIVWLKRLLQLRTASHELRPLRANMFLDSTAPLPRISWLVAGKDEEANIEPCLRSMLAQDYPELEIIAINDRSSDATGRILERMAAENPRLTAVQVSKLPEGWLGKNNAMREGMERAGGDWLGFTDADCIQISPRSLRVAMNYALAKGADFLSVLPAHDAQGFWERVIQPACSGIMMIWFNPLQVNNSNKRAAYANGAFMLMKRTCYNAIGGHDAVKAQFNEDMHMARLAKETGQRLLVVSNDDLYTVRMYESFKQIWNGWSRIFFGCFGTLRRLTLSALAVFVFTLVPWMTLAAALGVNLGQAHASPFWMYLTVLSATACVAQSIVMMCFYRLNHCGAVYGLFYPIGATIGMAAVINAMRRVRGHAQITWRGTTYTGTNLDQVVPAAGVDPHHAASASVTAGTN